MKIEGAIPRVQPAALGATEVSRTSAPSVVYSAGPEQYGPPDMPPRRPVPLRGALSSLRYQALQNAPTARADTTAPGPSSSDSQLAGELEKHFGELHAYLKDGRLTQSSLWQIAAQALTGD
ncbi:MAG: hypothetical protein WBB95_27660 [Pseudomonas sp.]|uniref:hypothetical protein n=1 Tax=Pseudomonas sp. TaxID=306 RepID=UPI003C75B6ED